MTSMSIVQFHDNKHPDSWQVNDADMHTIQLLMRAGWHSAINFIGPPVVITESEELALAAAQTYGITIELINC